MRELMHALVVSSVIMSGVGAKVEETQESKDFEQCLVEKTELIQAVLASYTDDRPYHMTAFLTAHNAYSNKEDGWRYRQQNFNLRHLFALGVRSFMLDVYLSDENEAVLCHEPNGCNKSGYQCENPEKEKNFCWFSRLARKGDKLQSLKNSLLEIKALLEENSTEIITLHFESHVGSKGDKVINKLFQETGLGQFLLHKSSHERWPTLGEMRKNNQRLVVFTDNKNQYFSSVREYQETMYSLNQYPACEMREEGRDTTGKAPLFLLNHFYTLSFNFFGKSFYYLRDFKDINSSKKILERVKICRKDDRVLPNFVAVDFVEIGKEGGALQAVKEINKDWEKHFPSSIRVVEN